MAAPHLIVSPYPSDPWRGLTAAMYLVAIIGLTLMVQARFPSRDTRGKWVGMEPAKLALLAIMSNSLLFVFSAALMSLGLWENGAQTTCHAIFWICVMFYCTTKVIITWFLIERVQLVHGNLARRRDSKLYLGNLALMAGWVAVFLLITIFNRTGLRSDEECSVTSSDHATKLGIAVDVFTDSFLSLLFIVPLFRGTWHDSRLRGIAVRSTIAAMISMFSTVANLSLLIKNHGVEVEWMCLACCTLDTILNATALFGLTYRESRVEEEGAPPAGWSLQLAGGAAGGSWVPHHSQIGPGDHRMWPGDSSPMVAAFSRISLPDDPPDVQLQLRRSSDKEERGETMEGHHERDKT